uniref:PilZ domain-containing protein n=1 Tax=Magnetococcus massalia (strain MO-1) TaxID=451514 RepID=A0A1S7LF58_MAGMO|nr:conserved protein of unknown function [include PilZ domain] [Candidatus Magnetococcus massalia]
MRGEKAVAEEQQEDVSRQDERIRFITDLVFYAADGTRYTGQTSDVSFSGAFLTTELPEGSTLQEGDEGVVEVTVSEDGRTFNMSFPCKIARITANGLGLNFDEMDGDEEPEDVNISL